MEKNLEVCIYYQCRNIVIVPRPTLTVRMYFSTTKWSSEFQRLFNHFNSSVWVTNYGFICIYNEAAEGGVKVIVGII